MLRDGLHEDTNLSVQLKNSQSVLSRRNRVENPKTKCYFVRSSVPSLFLSPGFFYTDQGYGLGGQSSRGYSNSEAWSSRRANNPVIKG